MQILHATTTPKAPVAISRSRAGDEGVVEVRGDTLGRLPQTLVEPRYNTFHYFLYHPTYITVTLCFELHSEEQVPLHKAL